jgi:hypothetical protein
MQVRYSFAILITDKVKLATEYSFVPLSVLILYPIQLLPKTSMGIILLFIIF